MQAREGNQTGPAGGPLARIEGAGAGRASRAWRAARRFVVRQPLGTFGLLLLLAMAVIAVFAPLLSPYGPTDFHGDAVLAGPRAGHPFGTDALGQDLLTRIFYGARIALTISGEAVLIGLGGGLVLGLISGYWSNLASAAIQRLIDAMMAFPTLIVALMVVSVFGRGLGIAAIAIGISLMPSATRVVRSAVLGVRVEPYIEAAQVLGASHRRIILQYLLPNVLPTVIVAATVSLGGAILAEAALSFLGLGAPPTQPSWGQMLSSDARRYMQTAPWLAIFPGLFLSLTVLGVNLLGDALRDVLDPRMRGT
jgi:peptide/nickel transport system permease protein